MQYCYFHLSVLKSQCDWEKDTRNLRERAGQEGERQWNSITPIPPQRIDAQKPTKARKKKGKWIEERVNSGGKKKKVHRRRCIDLIWPMGNEKGRIEKNINNWELGIGKTRDKPQHQYKPNGKIQAQEARSGKCSKSPKSPKAQRPKVQSLKALSNEQWAKQNKTKQNKLRYPGGKGQKKNFYPEKRKKKTI